MTTTVDEIMASMSAIIDGAGDRPLTDAEVTEYERLEGELTNTRRDAEVRARQAAYSAPAPSNVAAGAVTATPAAGGQGQNPLAFSGEALHAVQDAINTRSARRVEASLDAEGLRQITNVTLTTGSYGAPTEWGSNPLAGPRLLHVAGGVRRIPADAVAAEFPELTLPTATAGAGEGASLAEYDTSLAGTATLSRFGRFTDLSVESRFGTDARAILAMHQVGIALDLDAALIGDVETAAGTAAAFTASADVPGQIRTLMARVMANTAADDPANLVVLAHPDDVYLLQEVSPTGGDTVAERFQRFAGALVYPSNSVTAGIMTVAHLSAGVLFFEAQGAQTAFDENVKTGVRTVATALVGGYGVSLTDGFAAAQDVVTP